jgi:hypothetical protein
MKHLNFAATGCGRPARQLHLPTVSAPEEAALHTCSDLRDENRKGRIAEVDEIKTSLVTSLL